MIYMPGLAEKYELLTPQSQQRLEGYLDSLIEEEHFHGAIGKGLDDMKAGRVHDDEAVWQQMEQRFGPLEDPADQ